MLIQHAYHAFTIEFPEISSRLMREFILDVECGAWQGDQTVWIASDDPKATESAFPCEGDHMRALPGFKRPDNVPAYVPRRASATAGKADKAPRKPRTSKKA